MLIRLTENVRRSEPGREKPSASLDSSSSVTSGTVYRCCGLLGEQAVLSLRRGRSGQLLVWTASWFGQLLGFWDIFLVDMLVRGTNRPFPKERPAGTASWF